MAAVLDAGGDDLRDDDDNWEVLSPPEAFQAVLEAVKKLGIEPEAAEISMLPQNYLKLEGKQAQQMVQADGSARRPRRHPARVVELRHRGEGDRGLAGVKIFGIDPGSDRTGYGCVETDGSRHRLITSGAITHARRRVRSPKSSSRIHTGLAALLGECRPDCVAIENLFHAANARSALKLGHARGVAMLAAVEAGLPVVEYTPAEVKRAVVGYGRAEKHQVQQMVKLLLGLAAVPTPHDAADALAVAICHATRSSLGPAACALGRAADAAKAATSWRHYRPPRRS